MYYPKESGRIKVVSCFSDHVASVPPGPSAGVGRGGGRRGCVWRHAAQGARPAHFRHGGAALGVQLRPVPHGESPQAEGRHPGATSHPPAGLGAPGARLHPHLPLHLQGLQLHQHRHRAALSEVRHRHAADSCLVETKKTTAAQSAGL